MSPWLVGSVLCLFLTVAAAVLGAAGFLIYRDDFVAGAIARQVEMQYAYEERIAALRAELDRVNSRHSVQSLSVGQQLTTLIERQALIEGRQAALDSLVEKARASAIQVAAPRLPRARPAEPATEPEGASVAPLGYVPARRPAAQAIIATLLDESTTASLPVSSLQPALSELQASIEDAQAWQTHTLDALSTTVESEAERLSDALTPLGVAVDALQTETPGPQGGPYVPAVGLHFVERTAVLDRMLDDIQLLRRSAAAMPLKAPLTARRISSRFGYRVDPFLKRRAFHTGLDLVADHGTEVRATAPGVVVSAGSNGGYGNMVEIRHAGGVTTRYGHLSAMLVSRGAKVAAGTPIGHVGSTGRSTGAHLHYETRREGEPVNPAIFFAAGRALTGT